MMMILCQLYIIRKLRVFVSRNVVLILCLYTDNFEEAAMNVAD